MTDEQHHERIQAARAYLRRIKNVRKRDYARVYLDYLLTACATEPARGELSAMAAQAVRIELARILGSSAQ